MRKPVKFRRFGGRRSIRRQAFVRLHRNFRVDFSYLFKHPYHLAGGSKQNGAMRIGTLAMRSGALGAPDPAI
jgi:hypothetical protein